MLNGNLGLRYAHFEGMYLAISRSTQAEIAIQLFINGVAGLSHQKM